MERDDCDKIVAHREMPSHAWAKKNAGNLEAVAEVAEAERALVEAVEDRNNRQWSKVAEFREVGENRVNTALFGLADAYLTHGVAADEESALSQAKRAKTTINRFLNHSPATLSR